MDSASIFKSDGPASPAPLALLIIASTVMPVALNMYVPALGHMQRDLATSAIFMQLTLSGFLAASAAGQLVAGPLSDLYGRRPILIAGLLLFLAGTGICLVAPSVEWLIIGRIAQGLGGCTGLVIPRAIVRDIHGTARAASMIGYVTMGMAVAPLVTPLIGGTLYEFAGWRVLFLAMAALGAATLFLILVRLHETHPVTPRPGVFVQWSRELRVLLAMRDFWAFALTLAAVNIAFFTFVASGAFVAQKVFGLSASAFGAYFGFIVAGYLCGNFVVGRFGPRIGLVRMIRIGNTIALVGISLAVMLALSGAAHPLSLFLPIMLMGLGNGFALPNCVAGCVSVRPDLAGTASGLAGAFQVGAGALASVAVGAVAGAKVFSGLQVMLIPMLVGGVFAFALAFTLRAPAER